MTNRYAVFTEDYKDQPYFPKEKTRSYDSMKGLRMGLKALAKKGYILKEVHSFPLYGCSVGPTKPAIIGIHYYVTLERTVD